MFRLQDGTSLSLKDDPYPQVIDRDAFHKWVHEQSKEDLFSVHYQTMASLVKEYLEDGQPTPPGIKVFIKTGITRRSAR
jgi:hypothetical protein